MLTIKALTASILLAISFFLFPTVVEAKSRYSYLCSCVTAAKQWSGINVGPIGYARNHPINSSDPSDGAIIITRESRAGHLGVVVSYDDQTVTIREANYRRCRETYRTLDRHSPKIRGFYND